MIQGGKIMPRSARLDAPGTLHHVILRGIEKRAIVDDDNDRQNFVNRMGEMADRTNTVIYAWALMSNHAHILLRSSEYGLPAFMRRFLTGYAISYNRRHMRWGHLFQNRYKSIVCDEDAYFQELTRYIHLNPLRAKLVKNLKKLDTYPWCGHSVIMGKVVYLWQDRDYVLEWFGGTEDDAIPAYRDFVSKGVELGRRSELVGGGLIRSMGGWSVVKSMRRDGARELSDERILGSGDFVKRIIDEADLKTKYQFSLAERIQQAEKYIQKACRDSGVEMKEIKSGSRRGPVSRLRSKAALKMVGEFGLSLAETARQLGVTTSAIAKIMNRQQKK
jgi:REP-associated tyrosine transposase